jgi:acyl-coenzyme A thioesterase PaaI-like protein
VSEEAEPAGPGPGEGFPGVDDPATSTTGDDPLNRLAAAMRRISGVAVALPLSDEELAAAAAEVAALADRLEAAAPAEKRTRLQPTMERHPQDHFPTSPMIGFANPIAPPVDVWAVTEEGGQREIRGRVTFGYQYEGPPTCVHGGVIAELFDELLGLANIIAGQAGMTGTLKVRYRRPTPLLAPLALVSRFTGREGRKIFTWGGIYYQGELTAEADVIFIEVLPGQMLGIVSDNANVAEAPLVDRAWRRMMAQGAEDPAAPGRDTPPS